MSVLIDADGRRDNRFTSVETVEGLSLADGPILVPLTVIDAALADGRNAEIGLVVENHIGIPAIQPYLDRVVLVAVAFPSFSDGRGLSIAMRLRRAGFTGTLRARGPVIADQFRDVLACGFDEVELPDELAARQPLEQWQEAREVVTLHYQQSYGHDSSILQRRLAAKARG